MSSNGNTCYLIMENNTLRQVGTELAVSSPDSNYVPQHKFSVNEDEIVTQKGSRRGGPIASTSRTQLMNVSTSKTPVEPVLQEGKEEDNSPMTKDSYGDYGGCPIGESRNRQNGDLEKDSTGK